MATSAAELRARIPSSTICFCRYVKYASTTDTSATAARNPLPTRQCGRTRPAMRRKVCPLNCVVNSSSSKASSAIGLFLHELEIHAGQVPLQLSLDARLYIVNLAVDAGLLQQR